VDREAGTIGTIYFLSGETDHWHNLPTFHYLEWSLEQLPISLFNAATALTELTKLALL